QSLQKTRSELRQSIARDQSELARSQAASKQAAERLEALQAKLARAQGALDKTLLTLERRAQERDALPTPPVLASVETPAPAQKAPAAEPAVAAVKPTPAPAPAPASYAVSKLAFADAPDAAKIEINVPQQAVIEQRRLTPSMQMLVIS